MTPATGLRVAALIASALVLLTGCGRLATASQTSQPGNVATTASPSIGSAVSPTVSQSTTPDASGVNGSQLNQIDMQLNQIDNQLNQTGQGLATSEGDPAQ
jgi:hypothetical protein